APVALLVASPPLSTPSSRTRMLQPPPRTRNGILASPQRCTHAASSWRDVGCTSISAGPPTLREVYAARGSPGLLIPANSCRASATAVCLMATELLHKLTAIIEARQGTRQREARLDFTWCAAYCPRLAAKRPLVYNELP